MRTTAGAILPGDVAAASTVGLDLSGTAVVTGAAPFTGLVVGDGAFVAWSDHVVGVGRGGTVAGPSFRRSEASPSFSFLGTGGLTGGHGCVRTTDAGLGLAPVDVSPPSPACAGASCSGPGCVRIIFGVGLPGDMAAATTVGLDSRGVAVAAGAVPCAGLVMGDGAFVVREAGGVAGARGGGIVARPSSTRALATVVVNEVSVSKSDCVAASSGTNKCKNIETS